MIMTTLGYAQLLDDRDLVVLRDDPWAVQSFCFKCYAERGGGFLALDKLSEAVGFCLEQCAKGQGVVRDFLRGAGDYIYVCGDNTSVHSVRGFWSTSVRELCRALSGVDAIEVRRRFDGQAMDSAGVRPGGWRAFGGNMPQELEALVARMQRLLQTGVDHGQGLLVWLE
jgi:hypothetical protein